MTEEELVAKEREILAKHSDAELHYHVAMLSFRIVDGVESSDELREHRQICQEELERRRQDNVGVEEGTDGENPC